MLAQGHARTVGILLSLSSNRIVMVRVHSLSCIIYIRKEPNILDAHNATDRLGTKESVCVSLLQLLCESCEHGGCALNVIYRSQKPRFDLTRDPISVAALHLMLLFSFGTTPLQCTLGCWSSSVHHTKASAQIQKPAVGRVTIAFLILPASVFLALIWFFSYALSLICPFHTLCFLPLPWALNGPHLAEGLSCGFSIGPEAKHAMQIDVSVARSKADLCRARLRWTVSRVGSSLSTAFCCVPFGYLLYPPFLYVPFQIQKSF